MSPPPTLAQTLRTVLQRTSLTDSATDRTLSTDEFRQRVGTDRNTLLEAMWRVSLSVPNRALDSLTKRLRRDLFAYVDGQDRIGYGATYLTGPQLSQVPLTLFAETLVRAAVILGSARVAEMVQDWTTDNTLPYTLKIVLAGANIDEPFTLGNGIGATTLPKDPDEIKVHLPFAMAGLVDRRDLFHLHGRTVLSIDCSLRPALFKEPADLVERGQHHWSLSDSSLPSKPEPSTFLDSLSLAADHHVSDAHWCFDYGDLQAFNFIAQVVKPLNLNPKIYRNAKTISQNNVEDACRIEDRRRHTKKEVERAFRRWCRSKLPRAETEDKFIDLRIALEALYLKGKGPGESTFRIATHGAWHLGTTPGERSRYFKTLRDAYRTASAAVHGSGLGEAQLLQLKEASSACREGILRRLEEDTEPDWSSLIMGVPLDAPE